MNDYIIDEFYEDMKKVKFEAFGILVLNSLERNPFLAIAV